jgi:hypothetical protein
MGSKSIAAAILLGALLSTSGAPALAMDKQDRIWLRDTLVGGGIGLGIGLASDRRSGSLLLAGLILGAIVGYFDSERALVEYYGGEFLVRGPPPLTIDVMAVEGKEHGVPVLRGTVFRADW